MKTTKDICKDPFVLLLRKQTSTKYKFPGMTVTQIVVTKDVWEDFKCKCHKEYITPSEQLHYLMRDWIRL